MKQSDLKSKGRDTPRKISRRTALKTISATFIALKSSIAPNMSLAAERDRWEPTRPLRLVIPWASGGIMGLQGRLISERLSNRLGQAVVVDHRPGASGSIGLKHAASAQPDGYTLLLGAVALLYVNPVIFPSQRKASEEMVPIHGFAQTPVLLVAHPKAPYNSLVEMVKFAKENPGKINVGTSGAGTGTHLAFSLLAKEAGFSYTPIQYKSGGEVLTDLMGGFVDIAPEYFANTEQHIHNGRLKALAFLSKDRLDIASNIPTVAEEGSPGAALTTWTGLWAPPGTPRNVLQRLSYEMDAVIRDMEIERFLKNSGSIPMAEYGFEEFKKFCDEEGPKWTELATAAGLDKMQH